MMMMMMDWAVDTTDLWITDEFVAERWDRSLMHRHDCRCHWWIRNLAIADERSCIEHVCPEVTVYMAALKVWHLLLKWGPPGWSVCREVLELVGRQIAGSQSHVLSSAYLCTSSADCHESGYHVRARNKKWFSGDGCLPFVWRGQPNDIELSSTWPRFPSSCRSVALQYLEPCPSIGYVQYGVDSACETGLVSLYCGDTESTFHSRREGWLER